MADLVRLGDLVSFLDEQYPPSSAEDWDQVGLAVGDRSAMIGRVHYSVDVTDAVLAEAVAAGAQLIIAHHPLLLRGVHAVDHGEPKGRLIMDAVRSGVAIYCAHTNADKPRGGVSDALAEVLGLSDVRPLEAEPSPALDKITTYVPPDQLADVLTALSGAGAGALGEYDQCSFSTPGTGRFRPLAGADPTIGTVGETAEVAEIRVEAVLPRRCRSQVVAALLAAHPYEEPAWDVTELAPTPSDAGLGRVGLLPDPMTARDFAARVADRLPATVSGVRVAGPPDAQVQTVALLGGAGDSMLEDARRCGADVYLTSDLRHHPASEAREHEDSPVLMDIAHWAAEWVWLPQVKDLVDSAFGLPGEISLLPTDPWTFSVGARGDLG